MKNIIDYRVHVTPEEMERIVKALQDQNTLNGELIDKLRSEAIAFYAYDSAEEWYKDAARK